MSVTLPPEIEAQVHSLVETGEFPDPESAVREAFRLLDQQHRQNQLRLSIAEAEAEFDQGDFVEWNSETKAALWEEAILSADENETYDPDVIPPA
jgi:putative addiction module CopG family antidote